MKALLIRSLLPTFRRAGIQFNNQEDTTVLLSDLSKERLKLLQEEKMLSIRETELEDPKPAAPQGSEKISAIVDAIKKLNVDSKDLWTGAGVPKTEAIVAITKWDVSAKERDEAWELVKPK